MAKPAKTRVYSVSRQLAAVLAKQIGQTLPRKVYELAITFSVSCLYLGIEKYRRHSFFCHKSFEERRRLVFLSTQERRSPFGSLEGESRGNYHTLPVHIMVTTRAVRGAGTGKKSKAAAAAPAVELKKLPAKKSGGFTATAAAATKKNKHPPPAKKHNTTVVSSAAASADSVPAAAPSSFSKNNLIVTIEACKS
jgi:hypothetical protein